MVESSVVGSVSVWHLEEGWGVLTSEVTPGGCWTHYSAIEAVGYRSLEVGEQVRFAYETPGQDGYDFRATSVWPEPR